MADGRYKVMEAIFFVIIWLLGLWLFATTFKK